MRRTSYLLAVIAVVVAACSGGGGGADRAQAERPTAPAPSSTVAPPAPTATTTPDTGLDRRTGVGVRTDTYVDPSRPTAANGSFPGSSDRTFPVTTWYPATVPPGPAVADAPPERRGGPYPLIVFAHGYAVTGAYYEELLVRWASAGYVVAAPTYPIWSGVPGGPGAAGYELSFADTTFVITQLRRDFGTLGGQHPLAGLVDPARVGVSGHSNGQAVAYGVGFLVCCRDTRVRSVIALAGDLANISNPVQRDNGVPILHIWSERDEFNSFSRTLAWDREQLTPPKWSVMLVNAPHETPYRIPTSPYFDGVVAMTIDFWDGTLKDRPDRLTRIDATVAASPDLFTLER